MNKEEIHHATYILYDQYLDLQHKLEEKDKVIDEAINYINETTTFVVNGIPKKLKDEISGSDLLKILEKGKNENL